MTIEVVTGGENEVKDRLSMYRIPLYASHEECSVRPFYKARHTSSKLTQ